MGDNTRLKKGAWTSEEDELLSAYIRTHGPCTWSKLPIYAGLNRCGKSCRLRWMNYLRPDLKRGSFTTSEEELILTLHDKFGTSWSKIAEGLPGRSDNEIKNYWHTHLKEKPRNRTKPKKTKSVPKPSRKDNMTFAILESSSVRDLLVQKFQESSPVAIMKDPGPKEVYLEVEAFPLPELTELKIMPKAFHENQTSSKPDSEFEHMDNIISVWDFPVSPQTSDGFTPRWTDDFVMENLATHDIVMSSEPSQERGGNDQVKIDEEVVIMKNQVPNESAMSSHLDWNYWNDEFMIDEEVPVMENGSVDTNQMAILSEPCLELDPVYWNEFSIPYQSLGNTF